MRILFIVIFLVLWNLTYGQDPGEGLKTNKYFSIPIEHKMDLVGSWISNSEEQFSVDIDVTKRQVSNGDLNFSTDFVILKVKRFLYQGKDIASSFVSPIETANLSGGDNYIGRYIDPVTGNTLSITLKYINPSIIEFSARYPEISLTNTPEKGKVYPNRVIVLNKVESSIIGTWISEEDNNWKLVFKADTCYSYYDGKLLRTKLYSISNNSPQCGETVPIDNYTSYLKMTETTNLINFNCYEINGITAKYLSLRPVNRGGVMLFLRQ